MLTGKKKGGNIFSGVGNTQQNFKVFCIIFFRYHKQFYHGISSVSGKLFIKPIEQRMGKGDMIEGLCHQCHRYVPACNGKKKNNYMLWYRHAHKVCAIV